MTARKDRHTHYHTHWHGCPGPFGRHPDADNPRRPGLIRRVTQFAAAKTGLPRKGILALLIIGLIVNFPLALLVFIGFWLWSEHPDSLRRGADRVGATLRDTFSGPHPATAGGPSTAQAEPAKPRPVDPESEFADLRRAFDDLERRATSMERHVTSEEYELNQKFKSMANGDDKSEEGSR